MSEALVQAAADAGVRLTLLDTCYLAGGLEAGRPPAAGRRPAAVLRRRRRRVGRPGGRAARAARGCGSAPRCTRCGPCRPTSSPVDRAGGRPAGRCTCTSPSSRRRTRPARRSTAARRPRCWPTRARSARPPPPCTPPTSPATTSTALGRSAGPRSAPARAPRPTWPTGSGPFRRLRDAGSPLCLGSDQHAVTDLLGEARLLEIARAAGDRRARPLPAGRASSTPSPSPATARSAGRRRAASRPGGGPTWSPSGWTRPRTAGVRAGPGADGRLGRRRAHGGRRRPRRRVGRAGTCSATSAALLADAIAPLWEDA